MKFRDLTSEEIEVRVQSVVKNDKGVILLLYKDARVDQNILDESITPKYWQKEYYEAKGILFCKVGINVGALTGGYDTWVWKADCGRQTAEVNQILRHRKVKQVMHSREHVLTGE